MNRLLIEERTATPRLVARWPKIAPSGWSAERERKMRIFCFALLLLAGLALLGGCFSRQAAQPPDPKLTFEDKCSRCHGLNVPLSQRHTREGWVKIVDRQADKWIRLADKAERQAIAQYLFSVAGADEEPPPPPAEELPDYKRPIGVPD